MGARRGELAEGAIELVVPAPVLGRDAKGELDRRALDPPRVAEVELLDRVHGVLQQVRRVEGDARDQGPGPADGALDRRRRPVEGALDGGGVGQAEVAVGHPGRAVVALAEGGEHQAEEDLDPVVGDPVVPPEVTADERAAPRELGVQGGAVVRLGAAEVAGRGGERAEERGVFAHVPERRVRLEDEQVVRRHDPGALERRERAPELGGSGVAVQVILARLRRVLDAHEQAHDPEPPELAGERRRERLRAPLAEQPVAGDPTGGERVAELAQARHRGRGLRQEEGVVVEAEEAGPSARRVVQRGELLGETLGRAQAVPPPRARRLRLPVVRGDGAERAGPPAAPAPRDGDEREAEVPVVRAVPVGER